MAREAVIVWMRGARREVVTRMVTAKIFELENIIKIIITWQLTVFIPAYNDNVIS